MERKTQDKIMKIRTEYNLFVWLVGWFLNVLVNNRAISRTGPTSGNFTCF